MENKEGFHGAPVKPDMIGQAFKELGATDDIAALKAKREEMTPPAFDLPAKTFPTVNPGDPINYAADQKSDCRGAWGKALVSIAEANEADGPIFVLDSVALHDEQAKQYAPEIEKEQ